jgi:hypothetical protein
LKNALEEEGQNDDDRFHGVYPLDLIDFVGLFPSDPILTSWCFHFVDFRLQVVEKLVGNFFHISVNVIVEHTQGLKSGPKWE